MRAKVELRRHAPSKDMLNFSQGYVRALNQPGRMTYLTTSLSSDDSAPVCPRGSTVDYPMEALTSPARILASCSITCALTSLWRSTGWPLASTDRTSE